MNIGIIGCGSIAKTLVNFQKDGKLNVNLAYFYDLDKNNAQNLASILDAKVVDSIDELTQKSDLILECASQRAVESLIPEILESGRDVIIMSAGALMDEEFKDKLEKLANINNATIYLPTGAITGIDTVKAATMGEIYEISLTTRKPPASLSVDVDDEVVLFEGKASEAVKKFPKNINVSSTLSLASGINEDVKIIADPKIKHNTHEIHLKGTFGELVTITSNISSPENPKTSMLAAFSAASLLNKLSKTIQIGS